MNEDFIKLFYDESFEQIEAAEEALVSYEEEQSIAFIEEAFRSIHTIKGAANMFGFEELGNFLHKSENILDEIRNGRVENATAVTNKLLSYVDHLKNLLSDPKIEQEETRANHDVMVEDLSQLVSNLDKGIIENEATTIDKSEFPTFYLHISTKVKLEEQSGHPALSEIEDLAKKEFISVKPHLADLLYDYWDIYISDHITADEIEMKFMFYDTDLEVNVYKLSNRNLFLVKEFTNEIEQIHTLRLNEKLSRLTELINRLEKKNLANKEVKSTKLRITSLRVPSRKIEALMNTVSELVTGMAQLSLIAKKQSILELQYLTEKMEQHIFNLRDATFDMSLVPISNIENRLHRIVRNNSKELNKEIELVVTGTDIEIDKSFLELLSDPFMHILRNAIDHGIETPEERQALGKPVKGLITIHVYRSGADVVFDFKDDGRGIDPREIFKKGVEKGLVESTDQLSHQETLELIFSPGFSTAMEVTNMSGRGVGMDVVRNNVNDLKGSISISSSLREGTTFSIRVPLTLSIIDGMLFKVADLSLLIPLNDIQQCHTVAAERLNDNSDELLLVNDTFVPVLNLRKHFGFEPAPYTDQVNLIQVISGETEICVTVEEIMGEYQAVVKPIGEHYASLAYLAGASILGDGSVALVLETNQLQSLVEPVYAE